MIADSTATREKNAESRRTLVFLHERGMLRAVMKAIQRPRYLDLALKLLLATVATGVCLGVVELTLRFGGDPAGGYKNTLERRQRARADSVFQVHPDPELIYALRPNYKELTDRHGILTREEVQLERDPASRRVLVLGDSISAGFGLRAAGHEPYPAHLERQLKAEFAPSIRVEVLNFGTDGYSTRQEARLLELRAGEFEPDLLILQFCANDLATNYVPAVYFVQADPPRSFLAHRASVLLGISPVSVLNPNHPMYVPGLHELWERGYREDSPGWQGGTDGFSRIGRYADERSIPVLLVMFPLLFSHPSKYDELMPRIQSRVRTAGEERGFRILDLAEVFFPAHSPRSLRESSSDVYHVNESGHILAAEAIYQKIADESLLTPRRRSVGRAGSGFRNPRDPAANRSGDPAAGQQRKADDDGSPDKTVGMSRPKADAVRASFSDIRGVEERASYGVSSESSHSMASFSS